MLSEILDTGSRLPLNHKRISRNLKKNAKFPAGKVVQFECNSDVIDIHIIYKCIAFTNSMSCEMSSAIDVDCVSEGIKNTYKFFSPSCLNMHISKRIQLVRNKTIIRMYLPGYAEIFKIYIGVRPNSSIKCIKDNSDSIVFYGSSITQGCCASSPTKTYTSIVSDYFHLNQKNFGFSESAKGEKNIIDYISSIPAAIYVVEYDHNASVELLKSTHYNVYRILRSKNYGTPIIFMSRFSGGLSISEEEENEREKIIKETIHLARLDNDHRVFFVSGKDAFNDKRLYFVDDRHPNDEGMKIIADKIINCIKDNALVKDNDN